MIEWSGKVITNLMVSRDGENIIRLAHITPSKASKVVFKLLAGRTS